MNKMLNTSKSDS